MANEPMYDAAFAELDKLNRSGIVVLDWRIRINNGKPFLVAFMEQNEKVPGNQYMAALDVQKYRAAA